MERLAVERYVLYMFDFGAPVGMRMAVAHPERIAGLISQNANIALEGLGEPLGPLAAWWTGHARRGRLTHTSKNTQQPSEKAAVYVAGLWRYPVKSLAGEALTTAHLTNDGISGDRVIHVAGPRGPLTGRTRPGLLTVPAATGPDGLPRVAGHPWDSPEAARAIRAAAGSQARLAGYRGPERFDVLNLLVATDGAVAEFGADVRRLRPNLLIGGVPAGTEHHWPGHALLIGDAVIGIHSVRQRCIVTSIDPDTGAQDLGVFRRIRQRFGNQLALNAWVIQSGVMHLGDPVTLRPTNAQPGHAGGWILGTPYHVHKPAASGAANGEPSATTSTS